MSGRSHDVQPFDDVQIRGMNTESALLHGTYVYLYHPGFLVLLLWRSPWSWLFIDNALRMLIPQFTRGLTNISIHEFHGYLSLKTLWFYTFSQFSGMQDDALMHDCDGLKGLYSI